MPKPMGYLECLSGIQTVAPALHALVRIVRADKLCPSPAQQALECYPCVLRPLPVEVIGVSISLSRKNLERKHFRHKPQAIPSFSHGVFLLSASRDITEVPHAANIPLVDIMYLREPLEYPAVGKFQDVITVRGPG